MPMTAHMPPTRADSLFLCRTALTASSIAAAPSTRLPYGRRETSTLAMPAARARIPANVDVRFTPCFFCSSRRPIHPLTAHMNPMNPRATPTSTAFPLRKSNDLRPPALRCRRTAAFCILLSVPDFRNSRPDHYRPPRYPPSASRPGVIILALSLSADVAVQSHRIGLVSKTLFRGVRFPG